jgi:hypothetical protein
LSMRCRQLATQLDATTNHTLDDGPEARDWFEDPQEGP